MHPTTPFVRPVSPKFPCLLPNPTLVDPSKKLPNLIFEHFLSRSGQPTSAIPELKGVSTGMYIATLTGDTNKDIIFKLTARYIKVAHRLLAYSRRQLPHFCKCFIGGLCMIVMKRLYGKFVWQLRQDQTPDPTTAG